MGSVLIFAERRSDDIHPITHELLGKGRELADALNLNVHAALLGCNLKEEWAQELISRGADIVFLFDSPTLAHFDPTTYKGNLAKLIRETRPEIVLFGATHLGRSLAPRVAAALSTGLTADCTELAPNDDGSLIQIRPAFTGNILAHIKTRTRPQMFYGALQGHEASPARLQQAREGRTDGSRSLPLSIAPDPRGGGGKHQPTRRGGHSFRRERTQKTPETSRC